MEKCGKVWRQGHETAARPETRAGVYTINVAARTNEMRACSACAGDYEDPDRTAWTPNDVDDEERDPAPRTNTEEFPAEE